MRIWNVVTAGVLLAVIGCATPYSVKIDGDVQGADKDTPRVVKPEIHDGPEARSAREAGKGHLKPLTDARVTVSLKFKGEEQARASKTQKVDSRTAEFHFEEKGADGNLKWVLVRVEAPGRQAVERQFPHPGGDVPFDAVIMAVLDEALQTMEPVDAPAPAPAPKK